MSKIALLIGVSEYEPELNPLPSAVRDVEAMRRVLSQSEVGGFDQVRILRNPEPLEMQIEIQQTFSSSCKKNDLVLLFFSGHGVKDERGNLYLATRLTRKTERGDLIKATAVPAQFVHNVMNDCRSRRQIVILDCCFSGAFAEGLSAKDDGSVDIRAQLGGEGRAILTSSTSTQYSFEQKDGELSIYTRYLVEGMETGAADRDGDGMVAVEELHEYAKEKVQETAPAMKPEIYAIKEGYKILLAKTPVNNVKDIYRQEVERLANNGEISLIGRLVLDEQRQQLGISAEEAETIEMQVLKPYRDYQQKLQSYKQTFAQVIKSGPVGDITLTTFLELKKLQQVLGLKSEDVAKIEAEVIPPEAEPAFLVLETNVSEPQIPTEPATIVSQPEPSTETPPSLDSDFLKRCEQELARCIGPMASWILKDTLAENPQLLSPQQFIELLAAEIPNAQQAEAFTQKLLSIISDN